VNPTTSGTQPRTGVNTAPAGPNTTTTSSGPAGHTGASGRGTHASPGSHGSSGLHTASDTNPATLASPSSHHVPSGGGENLLPVLLVAALIAALGGLAFFRWRRRPAEE
jgi:uncharacterized protein HemX